MGEVSLVVGMGVPGGREHYMVTVVQDAYTIQVPAAAVQRRVTAILRECLV